MPGVISLIANSKILPYTVQPHYFHKNVLNNNYFLCIEQNTVVIDMHRCVDLLMLAYTNRNLLCLYSCIAYHDASCSIVIDIP